MAEGWNFKGQVFYHGDWALELNLKGREGENIQYCLRQHRERLVNCWHIFKLQENHQGGINLQKQKQTEKKKASNETWRFLIPYSRLKLSF